MYYRERPGCLYRAPYRPRLHHGSIGRIVESRRRNLGHLEQHGGDLWSHFLVSVAIEIGCQCSVRSQKRSIDRRPNPRVAIFCSPGDDQCMRGKFDCASLGFHAGKPVSMKLILNPAIPHFVCYHVLFSLYAQCHRHKRFYRLS